VPVLLHDEDLARTSGVAGIVTELSLVRLQALDVGERGRLGDRFAGTRISTLADVAALLNAWPDVTAFVDVKPQSIARLGCAFTVGQVLEALGPARSQYVFTCSDADAIVEARGRGVASLAWVLADLSDETRARALELAPQFLFCEAALLPAAADPLWPGPWRWAIYGVDRSEDALQLAQRGAHLIETMAIAELLGDPGLPGEAPHVA
jgi:glycerophosphoryl diester phosphodiesterase